MITTRIDAITGIPAERLVPVLPAPKSVKVEISPRCNLRCGFCALRTRAHQPTKDMDLPLFCRVADQMREAGVEEIGLFYLGESTVNMPLLVSCLRYAKRIGFPYVFLTSNGTALDSDGIAALFDNGLDSLKWSVNAADEEQFRQVMGVNPKLWHKALANIKAAWEIRGDRKTGLYASSIRYDGEQQDRMEKLLQKRVLPYVDQHYWLPLYSMGSFAAQREAELGYRPTAGNQGRLANLRNPLPCWSAFTEGHVTAEGKLSACCFDANETWTMGDLTKKSFMDAWNSEEFVNLRAAHLRMDVSGTPCEACVAY